MHGQRDSRAAVVEQWLKAGFDVGNHTYSHRSANNVAADEFLDDVIKGEVIMEPLLKQYGKTLTWLRYPFLQSGTTAEVHDIIVTFRGAPDGPGFNFAEPLVLCTGSEQENCDRDAADPVAALEGSGTVDGGTGILLPGEEIDYVFVDGLLNTATTPEAGELALVNNLVPSELLNPPNAFVRAYVNWGDYVSLEPTGEFDGGTAFGSLEARAVEADKC